MCTSIGDIMISIPGTSLTGFDAGSERAGLVARWEEDCVHQC